MNHNIDSIFTAGKVQRSVSTKIRTTKFQRLHISQKILWYDCALCLFKIEHYST